LQHHLALISDTAGSLGLELRTLKSWRSVLQHYLALISDNAGSLWLELRYLNYRRSLLQHHLALISDTAGSLGLELRTLKSWRSVFAGGGFVEPHMPELREFKQFFLASLEVSSKDYLHLDS
jgi:hypothetical protein